MITCNLAAFAVQITLLVLALHTGAYLLVRKSNEAGARASRKDLERLHTPTGAAVALFGLIGLPVAACALDGGPQAVTGAALVCYAVSCQAFTWWRKRRVNRAAVTVMALIAAGAMAASVSGGTDLADLDHGDTLMRGQISPTLD